MDGSSLGDAILDLKDRLKNTTCALHREIIKI